MAFTYHLSQQAKHWANWKTRKCPLNLQDEWGQEASCHPFPPPSGRDCQATTRSHNLREKKQSLKHYRETRNIADKLLEVLGGKVWDQTPGDPVMGGWDHTSVNFTSWSLRGSNRKYQVKIPLCFHQGQGEGNLKTYSRVLCSHRGQPSWSYLSRA